MNLTINNQSYEINASSDMPLLWALRDILGLSGTKYGCGVGICGTCVALADGLPIRSCINTLKDVEGKNIITIEGLSTDGSHKVQKAWQEVGVSQCGFCQPGQIMSAVSLLSSKPNPTDEDIDFAMEGNICRCGTYTRIREAIHLAATE